MQYLFSFSSALIILVITASLLFLARKNIGSKCGDVKDCDSCKDKCSRSDDD